MKAKSPHKSAIRVHEADNVATVLDDVTAGDLLQIMERDGTTFELKARQPLRFGHKVAVEAIGNGSNVVKYGESIGVAIDAILAGQHVHIHNVASTRGKDQASSG